MIEFDEEKAKELKPKPCPNCGSLTVILDVDRDVIDPILLFVYCPACKREGLRGKTPEEAVLIWNRIKR